VGVVEVCPWRRVVQAIDRLEVMKTRTSLNKASAVLRPASARPAMHDQT